MKYNADQNKFFYRHVAPGEYFKKGPFNEHEEKVLMETIEIFRCKLTGKVCPEWGLIARFIPGRVGYQCGNAYRGIMRRAEPKKSAF